MRFGQYEVSDDRWMSRVSESLPCCPPQNVRKGVKLAPAMPTVPCRQCPTDHGCPAIAIQCPDGSYTGYDWTPSGCQITPCKSRWQKFEPPNWSSYTIGDVFQQANKNILYIAAGAIIYLLWVKR